MSKDPCLQCEPIYIDPDIQDRTLSLLIKLPLFKLESELPIIIPIIRKRCLRGVSMTQQRPGDPVLLPTRHFPPAAGWRPLQEASMLPETIRTWNPPSSQHQTTFQSARVIRVFALSHSVLLRRTTAGAISYPLQRPL